MNFQVGGLAGNPTTTGHSFSMEGNFSVVIIRRNRNGISIREISEVQMEL